MFIFSTLCPCASMKYRGCMIFGEPSNTPTSSDSVLRVVFSLCLMDVVYISPFPRRMRNQV